MCRGLGIASENRKDKESSGKERRTQEKYRQQTYKHRWKLGATTRVAKLGSHYGSKGR